jgi:hypothetical protein
VIATFCLRLAAGLMLMLPILPARHIPPRFFRVHFLSALGLLAVTGLFAHESSGVVFWILLGVSAACCVLGSIVWHIDKAPGGPLLNWVTPVVLTACLSLQSDASEVPVIDDVAGALVLGSATTAMLMGHSYLIAPAMTIAPLMRLLGAGAAAVVLRIGLACWGLWDWTAAGTPSSLDVELGLELTVRWTLGLIAPLVLGWMAWETARIRSTQSATGILYVGVIVVFLGELMSQLVTNRTGYIL